MPSPKATYSFRLSNATIKKLNYLGYKLTKKGEKEITRTKALELTIDRMYKYAREGTPLF